jgi:hypothetical protein
MDDRDPIGMALSVIQAADNANMTARLVGGVAIALHSPTARTAPFTREYEDVDIVIEKRGRKHVDGVAASCGFDPDVQFNNLHGLERRTYYSDAFGKLDVFIGEFCMCHKLSFDNRLQADHPTVSVADLFLTKAQIFELNRKDAFDLLALLADHPVGPSDDDTINVDRVIDVCCKDWGFWRTVTRTFDTIEQMARTAPEAEGHRDTIVSRIAELRDQLASAPKSAKWKMRDKVGDRKIWYELPEDAERHPAVA